MGYASGHTKCPLSRAEGLRCWQMHSRMIIGRSPCCQASETWQGITCWSVKVAKHTCVRKARRGCESNADGLQSFVCVYCSCQPKLKQSHIPDHLLLSDMSRQSLSRPSLWQALKLLGMRQKTRHQSPLVPRNRQGALDDFHALGVLVLARTFLVWLSTIWRGVGLLGDYGSPKRVVKGE